MPKTLPSPSPRRVATEKSGTTERSPTPFTASTSSCASWAIQTRNCASVRENVWHLSSHRGVKTLQYPSRDRRRRIESATKPHRRDQIVETRHDLTPRHRRIGEKLSPRSRLKPPRPQLVQQPLSLRLRAMITMSVRPWLVVSGMHGRTPLKWPACMSHHSSQASSA